MQEESQIETQPQSETKESPAVNLKVERYVPDNLIAHYSDAATVLHSGNEFIVSFFQTEYPSAASKEELEQITSTRSKCVARVIMSPKQMSLVIDVLQGNMDKYRATYDKMESE